MKFDKYIPAPVLRPYISHFVIAENTAGTAYRVLPQTGLVMGFQYKGVLSLFNQQDKILLSAAGITGLSTTYKTFQHITDTGSVLVYFTPTGASRFFSQPLHELYAQSLALDMFLPRSVMDRVEEKLAIARTDKEKVQVVEQFLVKQFHPSSDDPLVMAAVDLIIQQNGNLRIAQLARQLYTSPSPLEKRFRKIVGASPKKFASIIRLQNILMHYKAGGRFTDIAYEAGYFDQAHFTKEFRLATGDTPEQFFSKK